MPWNQARTRNRVIVLVNHKAVTSIVFVPAIEITKGFHGESRHIANRSPLSKCQFITPVLKMIFHIHLARFDSCRERCADSGRNRSAAFLCARFSDWRWRYLPFQRPRRIGHVVGWMYVEEILGEGVKLPIRWWSIFGFPSPRTPERRPKKSSGRS